VHPGLDAAPAVIAAPSSPDSSAEAFRRAQGFVAGNRSGGIGCPRLGVFAGRDNCDRASGGNGIVALAGVEGTIVG